MIQFCLRLCVALVLALMLGLAPSRAVVTTTAYLTTAAGNGATSVFNYSFLIPGIAGSDKQNATLIFTDATGTETVIPGAQWSITGVNSSAGGTFTYLPGTGPIPAGTFVTLQRTMPLMQLTSISNQRTVYPSAIEQMVDAVVLELQQVNGAIGRTLVQPVVDTQNLTPLPAALARANLGLCFDSTGYNPIACALPASGIISSAMQPVVDAASLAAGRTAFGLGTMAVENINAGTCGGTTIQDDGAGNARVQLATVSDATPQTVTCAFHGTERIATGPITYTLPKASTLFNGFSFCVHNRVGGGAVTFAPNAGDTFIGGASGVSISIPVATVACIKTDAALAGTWLVTESLLNANPTGVNGPLCGAVGLKIASNAAVNTQVDVTADSLTMVTPAGTFVTRTGAAFSVNLAAAGAGGIDAGAIAASTWYNIYAIDNLTAANGVGSISASAPAMPTGYSFLCRLGAVRVDAATHLYNTVQLGDRTQYAVTALVNYTNTAAYPAAATGVVGNTATQPYGALSIAGLVPPTATSVAFSMDNLVAADAMGLSPNPATGSPATIVNPPACYENMPSLKPCDLLLETAQTVYYAANHPSSKLFVLSWKDKVNAR
jgi:hypothetical protein